MLRPELAITQYVHETWMVEDGLPQNTVYDVEQSPDGYIWLGTQAGLVRFDGFRFRTFDREDGLPNNKVRTILSRDDGSIWVATDGGGVSRFDRDTFTTYDAENGLGGNHVLTLYEDRHGALWAGTIGGGVTRIEGSTLTTFTEADGLPSNVVLAVAEAPDGNVLVGTRSGVAVFDGRRFTAYGSEEGFPEDLTWSFEPDGAGGMWVGTSQGLIRMKDGEVVETYTPADGLCGSIVSTLLQDEVGTLWIGSLGNGMCRLTEAGFESFSEADGLTNDRVRDLQMDHEGNLWIGTESGGLNRLRQGTIFHVAAPEGLSENFATNVVETDGATWVGTKNHGLNRIDSLGRIRTYTVDDGMPTNNVYALAEGREGLWAGLYGGGLCQLDGSEWSCFDTSDGLRSLNVFAVYEDMDGNVWIGTDVGLDVLGDGVATKFKGSDEPITAIEQGRDGTLWAGSYGGGLFRIDGDSAYRYGQDNNFPEVTVLALHEDASGAIWAGTHGEGLCRIIDGRGECLSVEHGFPGSDVVQVVTDDVGGLWVGTEKGISRMDLDAANDVLAGRADQLDARAYGKADGFRAAELNGASQPTAWYSEDGTLMFVSTFGIATIDPENLTDDPPPIVHVEAVSANGTREPVDTEIRLEPGRRDLVITYTGLSFAAPREVSFEYMLEGYDANWIDAGGRREAYYTNLSPGKYTFRVRAANSDGIWSDGDTTVSFYLEPFFYETWWFALFCGLAALGMAYGGYILRIQHLKARERDLEQQVDERTHDLRKEKERTEQAKHVIEGQASQLRDLNRDLEDQAEELRDLNDNLQQKVQEQFELLVEERRRYEADLIEAKDRAEASDRLKTAILNNLSHEFRTPLTAILGFTEIIAMEPPDDLKQFTGEIERGGNRLLRTLDALLDYSRLEADESGMRPEPVDLTTTAAGVVRELAPLAEKKGLPIHFKASAPARITVDASALKEVVWNLVDNAVKFTREGEIHVQVRSEGDRAFVEVRDTGIGIGPDFLDKMYDAFAQESDGFDRAFEGVGLGLTITQRLVDHMGGDIHVESNPGGGSTFTVFFAANESVASPA